MKQTRLIIGGARSGKSRFALQLGAAQKSPKTFIATAEAFDVEMAERIAAHRRERSSDWQTAEVPIDVAQTLNALEKKTGLVIIDCLTLWLSNLFLHTQNNEKEILHQIDLLMETVEKSRLNIIAVSNEVGFGIVPADPVSRLFRDLSGRLNQKWAAAADEVYLMTAGIPQRIKGK